MSQNKSKKGRVDVVYSTNPDFNYSYQEHNEEETLPASQQNLKVLVDRKQRAGKAVTIVSGFIGNANDLESLGKMLKTKCGVGGTVKNGEILIQGDFKQRIAEILNKEGYKAKTVGG